MGICYLLFYEHVSAAVWFVCEGAVCLDSLGERQCFKDVDGWSRQFGRKTVFQRCGWLYVTCSFFCMTGGFDRTGVDCRQVSCELPTCLEFGESLKIGHR